MCIRDSVGSEMCIRDRVQHPLKPPLLSLHQHKVLHKAHQLKAIQITLF
jgi:hypothetical protein